MALAGEVGELLEHFQWLTETAKRQPAGRGAEAVALEMADVLLYLVRLADKLRIDLGAAAHAQDRTQRAEISGRRVQGQPPQVRRHPGLTTQRREMQ